MNHIPLKMVTRLAVIFATLGLLLFIMGICIGTNIGLLVLIVGLLILVGTIIFIAFFSKCPYCGGFLKVGYHNHYCPHCGKYID